MDEYDDWSLLEAEPPHIDLKRRVWLSGRTYEVSACGGGYEPVAVRLTGRNAGGFIVTDLRGDVLPHDLVDVADLLQATLEGVATVTRHDEAWHPRVDPERVQRIDDLIYGDPAFDGDGTGAADGAGAAEGAGPIDDRVERFIVEADGDGAGSDPPEEQRLLMKPVA